MLRLGSYAKRHSSLNIQTHDFAATRRATFNAEGAKQRLLIPKKTNSRESRTCVTAQFMAAIQTAKYRTSSLGVFNLALGSVSLEYFLSCSTDVHV